MAPGNPDRSWLALVAIGCFAIGCDYRGSSGDAAPTGKKQTGDQVAQAKPFDPESVRPQVQAFCGDCHALPPPESFTKAEWPREVDRGYEFYRMSGRYDLDEPRQSRVVSFYQSLAPEKLAFDKPASAPHPLRVRFRRQVLQRPADTSLAAVAFIGWRPATEFAPGRLIFSDMHLGVVNEIRLPADELVATTLAHLGHPAIIEPSDLDADGLEDYLVGDLGTYLPEDHDRGRVLWLHPHPQHGWVGDALAERLGRVSQAVSGDFDGDQDLDVLVAAFGWRKTGQIVLHRRSDVGLGRPTYEAEVIDPRHGASHVLPIDWDQDGDLDFVALISQEHEKVELFINDGSGRFQPETLFAAGDPAYGSSGIELVDFDDDGDRDVLLTNGDSMDSGTLKPSHGLRWLENPGQFPFAEHLLTSLPGAFKATVGDIDGDGDRDVIALAFPPMGSAPESWPSTDLLVVLEQTAPGEFARHVLPEKVGGAALTAGDFDGDGDLDLATGAFHKGDDQTWVTVWWNEGKAPMTKEID